MQRCTPAYDIAKFISDHAPRQRRSLLDENHRHTDRYSIARLVAKTRNYGIRREWAPN